MNDNFREIVRDHGALYLRTATVIGVGPGSLRVISSEPLDKLLLQEIAAELGEITLLQPKPSATIRGRQEPPRHPDQLGLKWGFRSDGPAVCLDIYRGDASGREQQGGPKIIFGAQLMILIFRALQCRRGRKAAPTQIFSGCAVLRPPAVPEKEIGIHLSSKNHFSL